MGDCHPCPLVVCHDHLCADPGISRLACFPAPLEAVPKVERGKPELKKLNRQMFIHNFRRHDSASADEKRIDLSPKIPTSQCAIKLTQCRHLLPLRQRGSTGFRSFTFQSSYERRK